MSAGYDALRSSVALVEAGHVHALRVAGPGAFELLDRACGRELYLQNGRLLHGLLLREDGTPLADLYLGGDDDAFLLLAEGPRQPLLEQLEAARPPGVTAAVRDLAYSAERDGRWRVVRDGVEEPGFQSLLGGSLAWDPAGRHLAYAAVDGAGIRVVVDGLAGPPFDHVAGLAVAVDGRAGYLARRGEASFVVLGGVVRPAGPEAAHLALAPQGGRAAWAERRGEAWRVVVDGLDGPEAEQVSAVAADGARWGAILRRAGRWLVVVDGVELGEEPSAEELRLAGDHVAWLARRPGGQAVVVDGQAHRLDVVVEGTLVLDAGGHWAVVAGDAVARRVEILVDGLAVERFDFAEAALAGGAGAARARDWAAALLARRAAGGR